MKNNLKTVIAATSLVLMSIFFNTAFAGSNGMNLPPTQFTSSENIFPGIYKYDYLEKDIANITNKNITHLRVIINVDTGLDQASLNKIERYFAQINYKGIICMVDTIWPGAENTDGMPNSHWDMAMSWKKIHETFGKYPNILYEIFNEPAGYTGPNRVDWYMGDMEYIMYWGNLPHEKSILDGLGYAGDLQAIKDRWPHGLAYHFYPAWVPTDQASQRAYRDKMLSDLDGVSHRTYITEFGGRLDLGDVYNKSTTNRDWGLSVMALRGMHDAVRKLRASGKPVKGAYHWHGWNNGDTYDLWHSGNGYGAEKVMDIQKDTGGYYYLEAKHSKKIAQVNGWSTADGGDITQWTPGSGANAQFELIDAGSGYYYIKNRHSGKYAQVNGKSTADGADITQWSLTGGDQFKWKIQRADALGSGYFKILNRLSGKAFQVDGLAQWDGADITQWTYGGYDQQHWRILSVD